MIGIYFRPGDVSRFAGVPVGELMDRIVPLEDLWSRAGSRAPLELGEASEANRIGRLESVLLERMKRNERRQTRAVDAAALARWVVRRRGQLTVRDLAEAAGVSRQYLTRAFRERVGAPPKLYCRLARFHSALAYANRVRKVDWAEAAAEMGYADQSHMIAEFREFSSLTPQELRARRWFHPFLAKVSETEFPLARA